METKRLKWCVQKYVKPEIGAVVMLLQETGKMCMAQFSSHINGAVGDNPDQYYWETLFIIDRYNPNRMYMCREQRPYKETDTWVQLSVVFDSMRAASGLKTDAVIVETTDEKEDDWTTNATPQKIAEYIEKVIVPTLDSICPRMDAAEDEIRELNEKLEQKQPVPTIIPTPYPIPNTPNTPWPWTPSPLTPYYTQPSVWPGTFEVTCKAPNQ